MFTIIILSVRCETLHGEHLPVKMYTVSDGLVNNRVHRIVRDSRGFLWFCTSGGLSRFDGHNFVNYDVDSGLPFPSINDLYETKTNEYWIATNGGGVIFFNPRLEASGSPFTVYTVGDKAVTNRVNTLYQDRNGKIWAGTDGGVFVMDASKGERTFRPLSFGLASQPDEAIQVWCFLEDSEHSLWIGTKFGLFKYSPKGRLVHHDIQPSQGTDVVYALIEFSPGIFWIGHKSGLFSYKAFGLHGVGSITKEDRAGSARIISIGQSKDGSIWVSSGGGVLTQLINGTVHNFNIGLQGDYLVEDGEGNIWAATTNDGVARIYRKGFAIYGENDGLPPLIREMIETPEGELFVASGNHQISRLERDRFVSVKIPIPEGAGWRASRMALRSRDGDWWFATTQGLFRFQRVSRIEQLATAKSTIYTVTEGLAGNDLTSLYEDSRGDIWIGNFAPGRESLTRWERSTNTFHRYSADDGLPPFNAAISFREDRARNLWIGFFGDGLARYKDGRFRTFAAADGLPPGSCRDISLDHTGRLWLANSLSGLLRIDQPDAEHPKIVTYTAAQGLSSNHTTQVIEDQDGRIYATGTRTIDRLDPNTGQVRRYPVFDDLGISEFTLGFRDSRGQLWFGTMRSLTKFVPEPEHIAKPARVFIDGLSFSGVARPVSAIGDNRIESFEVNSSQNHVQIGFFGLGFGSGGSLRYQYRLDGIDGDWNAPTTTRSVTYAGLAPGFYRFVVRAIASDGTPSDVPALVSFRILPPFWRRWWFLTIAALALAGALAAFTRFRITRLKALRESENRFRTLAETASDAIITIDGSSTIVFVNQAAESVFGYTREELLGTKLTRLMPEYLRHLHEAGLTRYNKTGTRHIAWVGTELPGLHKDGHEIPLEISFGELERNGHRYFTGIARDITERKRAEAERKQAEEDLQRSREERLIELERVRHRIATDLHDDVGSSLTRISLLSEVVQLRVGDGEAPVKEPLSAIARLSRELVDSMSDIVWAINPEKDLLSDLTQRMRHFASDVFSARGVDFQFRVPDSDRRVRMGANFRRELFLVFKEAVNNIARHSECTHADIDLRVDPDGLLLTLTDNGRGFDTSKKSEGHGLRSMGSRAEGLGGVLEIDSSEGGGTSLTFRIPLSESERTGFTGRLRPT